MTSKSCLSSALPEAVGSVILGCNRPNPHRMRIKKPRHLSIKIHKHVLARLVVQTAACATRDSAMKKHEMLSRHSRAALFDPPTDPTAIVRHNTVSPQDLTLILRRRRDPNRLGFAVHLAYLRFPGRVLGAQEDPPSDIAGYARRDETRRAHLGEIQTQGIHRVRYAAIIRETSVLSDATSLPFRRHPGERDVDCQVKPGRARP